MSQRACEGCAFFQLVTIVGGSTHSGWCHHSSRIPVERPEVPVNWWCEHWWPVDRSLPAPWDEEDAPCGHGYRGVCVHCLTTAIRDGLGR